MAETTGILPDLPAVAGKPVHVALDGGRLTSDAGILLLAAIEERLKIGDRLAACIEDPRDPERVRHGLAEMIRYRALLIAAGYPDGNDCAALKSDLVFKMAVGRLPGSGADLCSQPTIRRLENLPGPTALKRMMAAMVELFCDTFEVAPRRTSCFLPIHIYEATTGKPVAIILRPGKTPYGAEVALVLRHVIGHIRARWPAVEIRHPRRYGRPEAMQRCERRGIGYIYGLAGNPVLPRQVGPLAEDAAFGRIAGEAEKVRCYGDFHYAANRWNVERRVIARVEAGPQGADSRLIVTNLRSLPKSLYEKIYRARGQVENLINAHKLHLASDRTSCSKATANQFRLLNHTAAYWLMLSLRDLAPKASFWRDAQFDTIHPDQYRPADPIPLSDRLRHARRPNYPAAAVTDGAMAPDRTLRPSLKPPPSRHRRHATPRARPAAQPRHQAPRE
jgi:hypothetical protein